MSDQIRFAGFWIRALARGIDVLFFLPLLVVFNWISTKSQEAAIAFFVVQTLIIYTYNLYFLAEGGQTPGKYLARIRVVAVDGSRIGWRRSFLRNLDDLVETIPLFTAQLLAISAVPGVQFTGLRWGERAKAVKSARPDWAHYVDLVVYGWLVVEIALLLLTRNKRTGHDFIAGTVVVRVLKNPVQRALNTN